MDKLYKHNLHSGSSLFLHLKVTLPSFDLYLLDMKSQMKNISLSLFILKMCALASKNHLVFACGSWTASKYESFRLPSWHFPLFLLTGLA